MQHLSPKEFVKNYTEIGYKKTVNSFWNLLLLGVFAGIFIGLGAALSNMVSHTLSDTATIRLLSGLVFPVGLVMVILTGSELFTGNCLISISCFNKKAAWSGMVRNLSIVYLGNFIGSVLLAFLLSYGNLLQYSSGGLAAYCVKVAVGKCSLSFLQAVISGILCNFLVCTAVMLALSSPSTIGKILGAYIPVFVFVTCGFEHSIANMFYVPVGIFANSFSSYRQAVLSAGTDVSNLSWGSFLISNLIPVTIGNIIGGIGFSAVIFGTNREK